MEPIKATNWAFRILLSWASVSDIVQLQDLHQTAFINSLNWDVGQAIKGRKGSFTKCCCDSLIFDTPVCEQRCGDICSSHTLKKLLAKKRFIIDGRSKKFIVL